MRKDGYDWRQWNATSKNTYSSSAIDDWLTGTYAALLSSYVRSLIGTTKIRYTPGNGNDALSTLQRSIFLLSMTELGKTGSFFNTEGTALPIAATLEIAYRNGTPNSQWARSPMTDDTIRSCFCGKDGTAGYMGCTSSCYSRPCFTLPASAQLDQDLNLLDQDLNLLED